MGGERRPGRVQKGLRRRLVVVGEAGRDEGQQAVAQLLAPLPEGGGQHLPQVGQRGAVEQPRQAALLRPPGQGWGSAGGRCLLGWLTRTPPPQAAV